MGIFEAVPVGMHGIHCGRCPRDVSSRQQCSCSVFRFHFWSEREFLNTTKYTRNEEDITGHGGTHIYNIHDGQICRPMESAQRWYIKYIRCFTALLYILSCNWLVVRVAIPSIAFKRWHLDIDCRRNRLCKYPKTATYTEALAPRAHLCFTRWCEASTWAKPGRFGDYKLELNPAGSPKLGPSMIGTLMISD